MDIINSVDLLRVHATRALDPKKRSKLGQFFTPANIGQFMASLFINLEGDLTLLEPGCGVGSLIAPFTIEAVKRKKVKSISITAYDIEPIVEEYLNQTLDYCRELASTNGISFSSTFRLDDFILSTYNNTQQNLFNHRSESFTHVITNPPYKKINNDSVHRLALSKLDIETVNLYSGFVSLAIKLLQPKGEIVAIIPRSFCNGPYYQQLRNIIISETAIKHIHIFESRSQPFDEDDVLQENIIIHCQKGEKQQKVTITSSPFADFAMADDGQIIASDTTIRIVDIDSIVKPNDPHKFLHIATTQSEQEIVDTLSCFTSTLEELNIEVSTGPVVDFRMLDHLRDEPQENTAPLLYPHHFNDGVEYPKTTKKRDSIEVNSITVPWLWENVGSFVVTKRFSSKEEKRRIVASIYDSSLPFKLVGFENKLNVYHQNKKGLDGLVAKGLYVYLNCTLIDKYYRHFGGHTQVNATDLRVLHYPSLDSLMRMGRQVSRYLLQQSQIDNIIAEEITRLTGATNNKPLMANNKIEEAVDILKALGMPRAQQNERSGLTLLALLNLHPDRPWQEIERPMLGVTPIMDWCRDVYGKEYAPNTRETFRRQTLHQFVSAGLVLYNPDDPSRAVNSPYACYQIVPELFNLLVNYSTEEWEHELRSFIKINGTLADKYAKERKMALIPLLINGDKVELSSGSHSQLLRDIVEEFGPRYAPGAEVIYIGDTGKKDIVFNRERLKDLGVVVDGHGKMPDVVLYYVEKNWLLLIESVTSHGPVDAKRHEELATLFKNSKAGLVYVTAFPNKKAMIKYLPAISWETEVWVADAPTHMIHFNGERFLGPY